MVRSNQKKINRQIERLNKYIEKTESQNDFFHHKIMKIHRMITKAASNYENYYNLQHSSQNIKLAGGSLLYVILRNGGEVYQKELPKLLQVTKQSITDAVKILEKSGLIKIEISEDDRRNRKIKLTEKALSVLDFSLPMRVDFFNRLVTCLNPSEWKTLIKLLTKLNKHYDKEIKELSDNIKHSNRSSKM